MIGYDIGLLSRNEAKILADEGFVVGDWQKAAQNSLFEIIESSDGDKIGFFRFPSLPPGEDIPQASLIGQISKTLKMNRDKVRLTIALSDWGWVGEREYLSQNPDFIPDFLFGSGPGSGVSRVEANDRCLWVRPYDKGRTVSEIQLYSWPDRSKEFIWEEPDDFKSLTIGLGNQYHDNPDVSAIFQ